MTGGQLVVSNPSPGPSPPNDLLTHDSVIDQAEVTHDPAGYISEGTITTVGKTKK